ncbi:MAG: ABC transporter permease [Candidatus Acidiferrales bacterium]
MNLRNAGIVYRKEMMDSLRDRRTIISMVVVPIIVFPIMTVGMGYLALSAMDKLQAESANVMIHGGEDSPKVVQALHAMEGANWKPFDPAATEMIRNKGVQAVVEIPPGFDAAMEGGKPEKITVDYFEGDMRSSYVKKSLEKTLDAYSDRLVKERLASRNLPAAILEPFDVTTQDVLPTQNSSIRKMGGMIPYLIILLCLTGAMYPAMDLTAGEKERGTMETILCSPVSRRDLVFGKFLMVFTASLATAMLSIVSMYASIWWAHNHAAGLGGEDNPFGAILDPSSLVAVILMVMPLSVLFSAVLITVALFAKSYREAQSYITPLLFVVILPAVAALLPGIELNARTALIPILSTCLVSKEIVAGNHPWGYIALVFAMSGVYGLAAIILAVKMFTREEVLFRT